MATASKKEIVNTGETQSDIGTTPNGGTVDLSTLLSALQSRAFGESSITSSEDTGAEKFATAIAETKKAGEASRARIESQADREIAFEKEQFKQQRESATARTGGAFNTAALKQLDERTEKSLKDMEQRKKELILAGESETARQISTLQVQEIAFKQQAEQQAFSNMLGIAGLGLSIQQAEQQKIQFSQQMKFSEDSAKSQIALQYGLSLQPGETMEDLYSRATTDMGADSPAALAIKQAKSTIDANNTQIAKTMQEIEAGKAFNALDIDVLVNAINAYPAITASIVERIKDPQKLATIFNLAGEREFKTYFEQQKEANVRKDVVKQNLSKQLSDGEINASQFANAIKQLEKTYGSDAEQPAIEKGVISKGLPATVGAGVKGIVGAEEAMLNWITGGTLTSKQIDIIQRATPFGIFGLDIPR